MFSRWKKRRQNKGKPSEQTHLKADTGVKTESGTANDTIKLVEATDSEERLPQEDGTKANDSVSTNCNPTDDSVVDDRSNNLNVSAILGASDEAEKHKKGLRRPSSSSIKWADLPRNSNSDTNLLARSSEAHDHGGIPRVQSTGSFKTDTSHDNSSVPRVVVWSIIPEEESEEDETDAPKMSSADERELNLRVPQNSDLKEPVKYDNLKPLAPNFPGLRKDSIDMYKKKKQNRFPILPNEGLDSEYRQGDSKTSESTPTPTTDFQGTSILKRRSSGVRIDKEVTQSVFTVLSGMYAMFLTILGAVLPIAEVFADQKHPLLFEIFYIYMYGGSIIFLGYVYSYLLRNRAAQKTDQPGQKKKRRKRKVSVNKVSGNTGSFYLRLGAVAFGIGSMIHNGLQFGDYFEVLQNPCRHPLFAIRPIVHLIFTFVQLYFVFMNSKMCINRFKVIARFGLMHMVATNVCVWFNTIVEETLHQLRGQEATPHQVLGENVHLHDHQIKKSPANHTLLSDHGFNMSVYWHDHRAERVHQAVTHLTTTVGHLLHTHVQQENVTHADSMAVPILPVTTQETRYDCQTSKLMITVLETVGPYLYPCSIEYSLICAGIIYTLWKNIGKRVMSIKTDDGSDETTQVQRLRVDCSNSSRGLFLGILVLVGTIITMVVFFVLVKTPTHNKSAVLVEYLSEIALFALSSVAVLVAALRMRYLRFNAARDTDFEEVLILISLTGDYMFQMLSIVAALFDGEQFASRLSIAAGLLGIIQSTLQTMFVLDGLRRSSRSPEQGRQKQGRESVTFLLITNIAMWCINTFEAERTVANPVQMHYYGALAWNILTHISIPLGIFFRFHSTVCLSNIWKRAWKSYT